MRTAVVFTLAGLWAGAALAQATPAGLWKTVDDETKQEKSHVRITDEAGVLTGKVEKLLDPAKQATKCDACTDERKGQPDPWAILGEALRTAGQQAVTLLGKADLTGGYRVRVRYPLRAT